MEDKITKKNKPKTGQLVNPITPLELPEKEYLEPSNKCIEHMCHNTPGDSASGKYVIKIPRFDSGMPEEWIIFVDLFQEGLSRTTCHY